MLSSLLIPRVSSYLASLSPIATRTTENKMDGDKMCSNVIVCLTGFILCLLSNQVIGLDTYQSTRQDDTNSAHALDSDVNTCTRTGFDKGPWWMVDLGSSQTVNKVEILGTLEEFEIRVGDTFNPLENHQGFENNPKCAYYGDPLNTTFTQKVSCTKTRTGRYLTIQGVNPRPRAITLCNVKVM